MYKNSFPTAQRTNVVSITRIHQLILSDNKACLLIPWSREANSSSASQNIFRILWNPKVHYRIHQSTPPTPVLSHIDPVHISLFTSRRFILILSYQLRSGLPCGLLNSGFPTKILYAYLFPIRATCSAYLSLFLLDHANDIW